MADTTATEPDGYYDEDAGGDDIEHQATGVTDGGHHRAALGTDAQLRRHAIEHRHARQVCGRRIAPRVSPATLLFLVVRRRVVVGLGGAGHEETVEG